MSGTNGSGSVNFGRPDAAPLDLGGEDGGVDTGTIATGSDAGLGVDASADAGGLDGGVDAGSLDTALNRTEVFIRELTIFGGRDVEVGAVLQERSGIEERRSERTFVAPGGETCVLSEVTTLSGAPTRIFVPSIQVTTTAPLAPTYTLVGDLFGVYRAMGAPVAPVLLPGVRVSFLVTPASSSAPLPALAGLSEGAVELRVPIDPDPIIPAPGPSIDLESLNTFLWTPASAPGGGLRVEAETSPDRAVRLICRTDDVGTFTLPVEAGRAFLAARGARLAFLRVFRRSEVIRSIDRLGGGAEDVAFYVDLGARYLVR